MGAFKSKSEKKHKYNRPSTNIVPFKMHDLNKYWPNDWTQKHHQALYKTLKLFNIPDQLISIIEQYAKVIQEGPSSIIITRKYDEIDFEKLKQQHLDDIHHLNEFKLAVFGKTGSGKSALVIRQITDTFQADYDPTIEDSYRKRVQYDNNALLFDILDTVDIFDNYGINQWQTILLETNMAFIVFDLSDYKSWNWIKQNYFMDKMKTIYNDERYPIVLVGAKCDLIKRDIPPIEIKQFIVKYNVPYIECSAKEKINIEKLFYIGYQEGHAQLGFVGATI